MTSFGEELRRERELRRITLREVAESTKITLRYLEALENNDFRQLPGGVFNRGFVRAYAQFIGIDPEATVTAYLMEEQSLAPAEPGASGHALRRGAPPAAPLQSSAPQPSRFPAWPVWLLGLIVIGALIVGGIYLLRWFADRPGDPAPTTTQERQVTPRVTAPAATPVESEPVQATPPAPEPTVEAPSPTAASESQVRDTPGGEGASSGKTRILVERPTLGRVNCDNRQIETLDGAPAGTRLELDCARFLIIDAADGGALRVAIGGRAGATLGRDGEPLVSYRIDLREDPGAEEERP